MDINLLRGMATVFCLLAFVGIIIWAYSARRKKSFDDAANLPFCDDETSPQKNKPNNNITAKSNSGELE